MKILLVGSYQNSLQGTQESFLKQSDVMAAETAKNGKEALEKLEKGDYDVLITELVMPVMDGYTLMKEMRRMHMPKSPQVIVTSALARDDFVIRAVELGAAFYMAKPFDFPNLLDHVRQLIATPAAVPTVYREEAKAESRLESRLGKLFLMMGIPAHIKGYQYLRSGIQKAAAKPELLRQLTKGLYPAIAAQFGTTPATVERSMRHAIDIAWEKGRIEVLNRLFGVKVCSTYEKPTNGEMIGLIVERILHEQTA